MVNPETTTTNIVVLIALPEEHDVFLEAFPACGDVSTDKLVRLTHDLGVDDYTLTSVLAEGWGSDYACAACYSSCDDLSPDIIICLGIAGGLTDDLNLGDVAISNEIVDVLHAAKVSDTSRGGGTRSALTPRNYAVDTGLQSSCRFLRSHPALQASLVAWTKQAETGRAELIAQLPDAKLPGLDCENPPTFQVGPIVCGPVVVSRALGKQLKALNRKVLAIETESGGIFRTALEKGVPAITIRGICDRANPDKNSLEAASKNGVRSLAMKNAVSFLQTLLLNPAFMAVGRQHSEDRENGKCRSESVDGPAAILKRAEAEINQVLEDASAEYKNRPNNAVLPIPRVQRLVFDDDLTPSEEEPVPVIDAIKEESRIYVKVARSYPEKTLAWSIGQSLLKHEIESKQILPVVIEGEKISPPSLGIDRLSGLSLKSHEIGKNFSPVVIINEPPFDSRTRMAFLISELQSLSDHASIIILTKAETPLEPIEELKSKIGLTDYFTTSVPFGEIASYLEDAFEMGPGEADAVAARLEDTFSKFRLNTHPAYFIGIEESTLAALIDANQRGELIQLAVGGILSFVVAADKSAVKLTRTTREEFLRELAYEIRVEKRSFSKWQLAEYAADFARVKALELEPVAFLKGFFDLGILSDAGGYVTFSLPYLESFLLSEKLKGNLEAAKRHFSPDEEDFDAYTFDLYCERGADTAIISKIIHFAEEALGECGDEANVFSSKLVRPVALATPATLVELGVKMSNAVETIASEPSSDRVRLEKQRLIDAREEVRKRVGARKNDRSALSPERQQHFALLDRLSRAGSLLATLLGSGAERLTGEAKLEAAKLLMTTSERFLHYFTENRLEIDFEGLRNELMTDEAVDEIIDQFELFDEDRDKIRSSLMIFVTDQELKALSGPLAIILNRLANLSGVRSLKPILEQLQTQNEIEEILRGTWFMDVEPEAGKRVLKHALSEYTGSDLLRFVLANHLMWRVYWHHWQLKSRGILVEVAKTILKRMGILTAKRQDQKMLAGHRAEEH